MTIAGKIKKWVRQNFNSRIKETEPETAYDLWADAYDRQPLNLMLALDKDVFTALLQHIPLNRQSIVDVGCGTGRHWYDLLRQQPARLVGYDVSREMLSILKSKFPAQEIHRQTSHLLDQPDNHFDLLVSTLTVAHIPDIQAAMKEWARVVKPGGSLIITDYHPATLEKGGQRTFLYKGKTVAVKNHIHPLHFMMETARALGLELVETIEKQIDESMRGWYEKQNALHVYEKFKGTPVIYGFHLKKKDAAN